MAGDVDGAANGGPLTLPLRGPADTGVAALPLRIARLPPSEGGLGLPQVNLVCRAAYAGQIAATLQARALAIHRSLVEHGLLPPAEQSSPGQPEDSDGDDMAGGPVEDEWQGEEGAEEESTLIPMLSEVRDVFRYWQASVANTTSQPQQAGDVRRTQHDSQGDVIMESASALSAMHGVSSEPGKPVKLQLTTLLPASLLAWTHGGQVSIAATWKALLGGGGPSQNHASSSPRTQNLFEGGAHAGSNADHGGDGERDRGGIGDEARTHDGGPGHGDFGGVDMEDDSSGSTQGEGGARKAGVQRHLAKHLMAAQARQLKLELGGSGMAGRVVAAQLRSQSGKGALLWIDAPQGLAAMHTLQAVTMVLMAIMVDPWAISGDKCHLCHKGAESTAGPSSVHSLSCKTHHERGCAANHTVMKRTLQRILTRNHAPWWTNEDRSCFKVTGRQVDTVLAPGSLALCGDSQWATKGLILDTTIRTPTSVVATRAAKGATVVPGWAAKQGELAKAKHYQGTFDESRWILLCVAQESFGRLGEQAVKLFTHLAVHSAACSAGGAVSLKKRAGALRHQMFAEMSSALAREMSERVIAYAASAGKGGRSLRPASKLLVMGAIADDDDAHDIMS